MGRLEKGKYMMQREIDENESSKGKEGDFDLKHEMSRAIVMLAS